MPARVLLLRDGQLGPHAPRSSPARRSVGPRRRSVPPSSATRSRIPTRPAPEPGARGPSDGPPYGLVTLDRRASRSAPRPSAHRDPAGRGVLERVGQGLLDDAVRGQLDRRRQRPAPRGASSSVTGRARSTRPLVRACSDAGRPAVEGRRGGRLRVAAAVPQQPDQPPHLGQPVDAVLPDDPEGLSREVPGRRWRARRWSGWRWRRGGWRPCRATRGPSGRVRRSPPGAVHLGQQRGLFGAQPGGLGGVAVVAHDRRRSAPGRTPRCRRRTPISSGLRRPPDRPSGTDVDGHGDQPGDPGMRRAAAGGPYSTAAYTRSVNISDRGQVALR